MQDFLRRAGLSVVSARDLTPVRMPVRPESYCLLFPVDQPETDLVREGDYVVLHVLPDGHFRVNTLTSDEFEARYELAD